MIKTQLSLIFFILPVLLSGKAFAQNDAYLQDLITTTKDQGLAQTRQWKKLLFYDDRPISKDRSMIDDKSFFLAHDGYKNPESELEHTLKKFFSSPETKVGQTPLHPQCFYAARFEWLREKLNFDFNRMRKIHCEDLEKFKKLSNYQAVSIVFSNYFINNPASMFGHTFFRLHKNNAQGKALLDDAVNYAAFVKNMNLITYPIKGLFGGFPGRFSLIPYFDKVNEYSNSESRDLWEYKLNFTPRQSQKMALVLWELGNTHFDYYYLSKNCSFILLAVMEAVDPKLQLTKDFSFIASPEATIKAVNNQPNLVKEIKYRPSNFSRYLIGLNKLEKNERRDLKKILAKPKTTSFSSTCQQSCQSRVLDTALDYIEYRKRNSSSSDELKKLRLALLVLRSKNQTPPQPMNHYPVEQRPDKGHATTLLGLTGGVDENKDSIFEFRFRPALHDLNSQDQGYNNTMEIKFLDTKLNYNSNKKDFSLNHLDLVDLLSLPRNYTLISPWAWHIGSGIESYNKCFTPTDQCHRFFIRLGAGKAWHILSQWLVLYNILHIDMGLTNEVHQYTHIGPWNTLGLIFSPLSWFKITSSYHYSIHYGEKEKRRHKLNIDSNFYLNKNLSLQMSHQNDSINHRLMGGFQLYF